MRFSSNSCSVYARPSMFLLPNRHASQVHALSALRARAELDQKFCQGISSLWYGSCGVQGTAHVLSAFMDARGFEYALADGSGEYVF